MNSLKPWQRVNHFPATGAITRKDTLCRTLRRMRAVYGAVYNIVPRAYLLPNESLKFTKEAAKMVEETGKHTTWIFKVSCRSSRTVVAVVVVVVMSQ